MAFQILVADDSLTIQKVVKIAFARYDVNITDVHSLADTLTQIQKLRPGLIIADAGFVSDASPAETQRLQSSGCPVILLIGSFTSVNEDNLKNLGFKYFLKKPFEVQDINNLTISIIGKTLTLKQAETPNLVIGTQSQPMAAGFGQGQGAAPQGVPPIPPAMPQQKRPGFAPPPPPPPQFQAQNRGTAVGPLPPPPKIPPAPGPRPNMAAVPPGLARPPSMVPPPQVASNVPPAQQTRPPRDGLMEGINPAPRPAAQPDQAQSQQLFQQIQSAVASQLASVQPKFDDEMVRQMVQEMVTEYCKKHFPGIAREIITEELRRLAAERTRNLVDS